jgi:hypothetical protein
MTDSKIEDGGHAFPVCFEGGQNSGEQPYFHEGMSLRDWFAGQVIGHLAACDNGGTILSDAQAAYHYADSMLAARKAGA